MLCWLPCGKMEAAKARGSGLVSRRPQPICGQQKGAIVRLTGAEKRSRRIAKGLPPYTDQAIATMRSRGQRLWDAFAPKVAAYKMEQGCTDCGYREHPAALQFDHLPGTAKRGQISRLSRYSWERVLEEFAKCEVVCANCHAIRTTTRWRDGTTVHPGTNRANNEKRLSDAI